MPLGPQDIFTLIAGVGIVFEILGFKLMLTNYRPAHYLDYKKYTEQNPNSLNEELVTYLIEMKDHSGTKQEREMMVPKSFVQNYEHGKRRALNAVIFGLILQGIQVIGSIIADTLT